MTIPVIELGEFSYSYPVALAGFISTCISLAGIVFVFLVYAAVPETRTNFFFTLGFYISISDLIFVSSTLYVQDPIKFEPETCAFLGMGREFGFLTSISWSTIIAWCVYRSVKHNITDEELFKKRWLYLFLGYVPALLVAGIPQIASSHIYGPYDVYCWISHYEETYLVTSAEMYYGPFLISFVFSMFLYYKTMKILRVLINKKMSQEFMKLMLYPIILFVCNIGAIVQVSYAYFTHNSIFWIQITYIIVRQLQGFFDAVVYAMNYGVRVAIKRRIRKLRQKNTDEDDRHNSSATLSEALESFSHNNQENMIAKYFNMRKPDVIDSSGSFYT